MGFKSNKLANRAKLIRDHGMSKDHKYWHLEFGTNTRMTALQAALGISQLNKIEFFNIQRRKILKIYQDCLETSKCFMVWSPKKYLSVWFVNLTIKHGYNDKHKLFYLSEFLKENNIETRPCFHNLSDMPLYNKFSHNSLIKDNNKLINIPSKNIKLISLPTYIGLDREEISKICDLILKFES